MSVEEFLVREQTRRQFYANAGFSIGGLGLASLLSDGQVLAAPSASAGARATNPLAPLEGHFPARAKNVIYLFMAGGPSHLELYDDKPKLRELTGQVIPPS